MNPPVAFRFLTPLLCILALPAFASDPAAPFSGAAYAQSAASKGVVLVAARWARQWKCGRFDHAQLKSLSFDKAGSPKDGPDAKPDLLLEDSALLPSPARFINHAYIVEPGEYALSAFSVKVAKSASDVGYINASRSDLMRDGKSLAGSFSVAAGEVVYIGHFALDCMKDPIPWRYHPASKDDFNQYLKAVKVEFEAIDTDKVTFRLFDTTTLGQPFALP